MDLYGMDLELDLENVSEEGYSVEDILAEFHSDSGADMPAIEQNEETTVRRRDMRKDKERRDGGRHEKERGRRAPLREERSAADESEAEDFASVYESLREESEAWGKPETAAAPDEPETVKVWNARTASAARNEAPAEAPPAAPAESGWSFSERRSQLPSEAEIRAFMAEYAGGESAEDAPEEAPRYPGEPEFDERFHVGGRPHRDGVSYAGRHIDQSADEKYTAHEPSEYVSSYAPERAADDEQTEEKPKGLFGRMKDTIGRERQTARDKERARREAAHRLQYPSTQDLVLPGEETEEEIASILDPEQDAAPEQEIEWNFGADIQVHAEPSSEPEFKLDIDEILREERAQRGDEAVQPASAAPETEETAPEPAPEAEHRVPVRPRRIDIVPDEGGDGSGPSWSRTAASRREYAVVFPDVSASPAVYAAEAEPEAEDESAPGENEGEALKGQDFFPTSFKEYIFSLLTSFLYRLRGGARGTMTMDDEEEDLGEEVTTAFASKYYGSHIRSMRLRLRISLILLAVLAWISLGLPVTGQLNNTAVASFLCLALQFGVMLLCLDVFTGGVLNGARGRPGLDTMAVLACFTTSVDAVFSGLDGFSATHMPLCLLSSASLTGVLASSLYSCRALRKTLRVPAIARRSYTVTGETNVKNGEVTLLKSVRPIKGFIRRTEEAAPDETMFRKLCLPILALVLLLAVAAAALKKNVHDFFYILSVLLCPAVPFAGLLSFAMPFFTGSMRLFPSGAGVAGWSGVSDIGQSKNLIVTDRDLFPDGSVKIASVRIFADADPVTIISYAGSMLTACGSSVSSCFGELMEKNGGRMRQIENFEYLPGGGMRGVIDSRVILCGSTDLMQLMNVSIPSRLVSRTSVLLAMDGLLYGIFNMQYEPLPAVRSALIALMRSGRHPVFAIRDFNVTPAMLHDSFNIATDGYDFPPYVERFAMSEGTPGPDSKVAAVVCRDGLGPLGETADIGRSIYVAVRANLIITLLGTVAGIVTAFVQLMRSGGVGIPFLFFFMLLWALPVIIVGRILRLGR